MLPKTDARYKKRMHDWEVLEKRFGTKKTTYKPVSYTHLDVYKRQNKHCKNPNCNL